MNINWYPGHMKKTVEEIQKKLKLVDFYIEILDARIPYSSQNPLLREMLKHKKGLILLNKKDLADEAMNARWAEHFSQNGNRAMLYTATKPAPEKIVSEAKLLMAEELERQRDKDVNFGPLRAMIVGIPNSGKSTFINGIVGSKSAKVGNRPGITTTHQWIKLGGDLHLLDTPGVLWPKFEDQDVGLSLAFTGAIRDEILDTETLALRLIERLQEVAPTALTTRYGVDTEGEGLAVMEAIGRRRGALLKGAEIDYTKTAGIILDEFRKGVLGRITLERPDGKL
ncbi:ribosome biogenesis GTPase YlqF [Peptoniphilus equinus]|uniref:Ribosome biogenesis GTPase A n=1 Tax=Peptoniphilus equinus TaxID=3016343 RepID=A0ABY7QSE6_9FIRM|nr:ribosome biogenesis GTPase YlqF [Peptoniphilus equinus]WBW49715.1 ribosome biogenesis GTPase YlqF [Peptoniphilus equinus]